ncbi:hypothetical protein ARALYDRAFT_891956 [Arabidopsis lyrata subsp. lyrata]|uniref:Isopropylmalate dehydrogenase-like domain-containing protein n=1 Tax=Arabidopsis lyrata subsp. lyrata TaxID=81972 RepID=D7KFX6_ARALL|nr:hypothetical protein ARALYDRAFT_891956 [Arabidopsis lyrata subsp. lyrata]
MASSPLSSSVKHGWKEQDGLVLAVAFLGGYFGHACRKAITKFRSEGIAEYAFEYAYLNNRKKIAAVHKANIMKPADCLFLLSCREVAKKYPCR